MARVREVERAVERLSVLTARCQERPLLEKEVFLDSRRPGDRWEGGYFETLEDEFRYRTLAIVREARRVFGSPSHEAFLRLSWLSVGVKGVVAAAWSYENVIVFVYLSKLDADFYVVLGAAPRSGPGPRSGGGPGGGGDEMRDAVFVPR